MLGLLLSVSGSAFAQEWAEYQNIQDGFKVDFPGQPKVTPITWKSEHNFMLPTRVYSVDRAFIGMHQMKLYVVEGTVPKGYPPPALFQTSLGWVDKDGKGIRYRTIYNNEFHVIEHYPVPAHGGGGGQQP